MITENLFPIFVVAWIGFALLLFPVLLKIPAPYGRHSSKNWGPMISNRLGWFLMELPALLLFSLFVLSSGNFENSAVVAASVLWIVHYFHRAILFPLRIHTRGKKMPVVIMILALVFNLINGFINGYWLGHFFPDFSRTVLGAYRLYAGIFLFLLGFITNQYHDRILIRLRKENKNGYSIPFGGMFRYVSCPNFLGEIIEWGGYTVLTWGPPSLSFFIWTLVNLIPRALDHHKWYKKNFADYPSERKAIFPFLV